MEPRITIVTLGVEDLGRAIKFYEEGLGLPRRESDDDIAFFELGGTTLALYDRSSLAEDIGTLPDGSGFQGFTLAHNVSSREHVDKTLLEAQAAGGEIVKTAQVASWGGYSGYFRDPDGFYWEVAHDPEA